MAETLTGTPIGDAKLVFTLVAGTREVTTQADGAWEISQASSESLIQVEASATGYVTRRTYLKWNIGWMLTGILRLPHSSSRPPAHR